MSALKQAYKMGPEISDAIISFDPETLERLPVFKQQVVQAFLARGNRRAARIAQSIPDRNGVLDARDVDRILITAHCEMQRLSEEFQQGQRVCELLKPLLHALKEKGVEGPIRVVDLGCGTGFVLRWLAAHGNLGDDVELIGADYNAALIGEAQRLARVEGLSCRFVTANAFRLSEPASVFISTGVLHHFRGNDLVKFFKQHNQPHAQAFLHFDFQPSLFAPLGSWLFHTIRMREPLVRHDGVLSAMRVYTGPVLLAAARVAAPEFLAAMYGTRLWKLPIPRVFHNLVGIRPAYKQAFIQALGKRAERLGAF